MSSILGRLIVRSFPYEDFKSVTEAIESNSFYRTLEFIDGSLIYSNIYECLVNPQHKQVLEALMLCKPNIGTPNAATGEFELALLLTIAEAEKPKKGDLSIFGTTLNLKNKEPRILSEVLGKDLNLKMIEFLSTIGVKPKHTKGIEYANLMVKTYIPFFNNQFKQLKITNSVVKSILSFWLVNLFPSKKIKSQEINEIVENSVLDNQIIWENWSKNNMIFIHKHTDNMNEFFVMIYENGDIFHLTKNNQEFEKLVMSDKIIMTENFFRLNQSIKCGVYLKFKNF